jgi:hypothetical protein
MAGSAQIRSEVQKLLENHRAAGRMSSSLQAESDRRERREAGTAEGLGDDLRFVPITSRRKWSGCERSRRNDPYAAATPEMPALLALARGRGAPTPTIRDLRALCAKPLRFGEPRRFA